MKLAATLLAGALLAAGAAPALAADTDHTGIHASLAACDRLGERPTGDQIRACTTAAAEFVRAHKDLIVKAEAKVAEHREAILAAARQIRANEAEIRAAAEEIRSDAQMIREAERALHGLRWEDTDDVLRAPPAPPAPPSPPAPPVPAPPAPAP